MKTKIKLLFAVVAAGIAAALHRATSDAVALGNAAGEPPKAPPAPPVDLEKENAELKEKVAKLEAGQSKDEPSIRQKMAAGLSREQAVSAIKHQKEFTKRFNELE